MLRVPSVASTVVFACLCVAMTASLFPADARAIGRRRTPPPPAPMPPAPAPGPVPGGSTFTFEAERDLAHQRGRVDRDGWSCAVAADGLNFMSFGPYTRAIPAGPAVATFRLMVDNNTADDAPVVTIDVHDADSGRQLAERVIRRRAFGAAFTYQDFSLRFDAPGPNRLEFRTLWHDQSYVRQDRVVVAASPGASPAPPSAPPAPAPAPSPAPPAASGLVTATPIARTTDPGFFSLKSYQNVLVAGTYGTGKVYASTNGFASPVADFNAGESVYVMKPFGGHLYANTENRGEIWRSRFGTSWEKVFDGEPTAIGTGLVEHGGWLYACYTRLSDRAGRIYRSRTGARGTWEHVFGNARQGTDVTLRELVVYQGTIHCLSYDYDSGIGGFYTSRDGRGWTWSARAELRNVRPIKAHVWNGALWISTSPFTNRRTPPAGLYRYDGQRLTVAFEDHARAVGTDIIDFNGELYFCDDVNWRARSGRAALFRSPTGAPGTWQQVTTFDEAEAMDMEVHGGQLHVATRQEGGRGKVYRIDNIPAASPPAPSPTPGLAPAPGTRVIRPNGNRVDGGGGFLWKPVSDGDGKLVVLAPAGLTGQISGSNVLRANGSRIEAGRYTGVHNGGREHFRYNRPGRDYPAGCILELVLRSGDRRHYVIPRPGERFD